MDLLSVATIVRAMSCSTIVEEPTIMRFLCDSLESKTLVSGKNCGTIVDSLHNCGHTSTIVEAEKDLVKKGL